MAHVLVADDSAFMCRLMAAALGAAGYAVTAVPDGARALALLADPTTAFAAAVLDHRMPGLTGAEVLARARRTRPTLPVLVVSGDPDAAAAAGVAADPHAAFLAKPFTPAELVRAVGAVAGGPPRTP